MPRKNTATFHFPRDGSGGRVTNTSVYNSSNTLLWKDSIRVCCNYCRKLISSFFLYQT